MSLLVEKRIRGGVCHKIIDRYAKSNNNCMENSTKNIESSYLMYLDTNNLYGWMSQKLLIDGFKRKKYILKFNEEFIKNFDEDGNKGYILEVDVEYLNDLDDLDNDLPFLPEIMIINKCYKLVCNLYDKQD